MHITSVTIYQFHILFSLHLSLLFSADCFVELFSVLFVLTVSAVSLIYRHSRQNTLDVSILTINDNSMFSNLLQSNFISYILSYSDT